MPQWYPGDLHVHTTYSYDVGDLPSEPNYGYTVAQQIARAEIAGLSFLALTDHDDIRSAYDAGYHSDLLTLIPGYEHTMEWGHAGLLGIDQPYTYDTSSNQKALEFRGVIHNAGGIMIANHPRTFTNWGYDGQSVRPDGVECWNAAGEVKWTNNWFNYDWYRSQVLRNHHRVAAVAGSDIHGQWQNRWPGQPCTWVYANSRSVSDILDGIKASRTVVTYTPFALGGPKLWMYFDTSTTRYAIGDQAPAGGLGRAKVRVVNDSDAYVRFVVDNDPQPSVRATNDYFLHELDCAPSQHIRAEVWRGTTSNDGQDVSVMHGFTSPIYFAP